MLPHESSPMLPHACANGNCIVWQSEHQTPGVTNSPQGGVAACRILAAKAEIDADGVVRRMLIPEQSITPSVM